MIITRSYGYWSTGITVRWFPARPGHAEAWGGHLDYLDDGFCDDDPAAGRVSTEGTLGTRYPVEGVDGMDALAVVLDVLIADAQRLGVAWRGPSREAPMIYYHVDGEDADYPPPAGWRDLLREQAQRLGWATYGYQPTEYYWIVWAKDRREIVGGVTGHDLVDEDAALRQLATKPYDFEHTKANSWLERVDKDRFDALGDWDALSEDEKQALRPAAVTA